MIVYSEVVVAAVLAAAVAVLVGVVVLVVSTAVVAVKLPGVLVELAEDVVDGGGDDGGEEGVDERNRFMLCRSLTDVVVVGLDRKNAAAPLFGTRASVTLWRTCNMENTTKRHVSDTMSSSSSGGNKQRQ
jgi:hypothetical protein